MEPALTIDITATRTGFCIKYDFGPSKKMAAAVGDKSDFLYILTLTPMTKKVFEIFELITKFRNIS